MEEYILTVSMTAESLYRVFEDAVRMTCAGYYTPDQIDAWVERADLQHWESLLESGLHFIAARHILSDEIVGFISVDSNGYLHDLFVDPLHQCRGVGSLLMYTAEKFVVECKSIMLDAEVSLPARRFFEKRGFHVLCTQEVDVLGIRLDNFVMQKSLVLQGNAENYDELLRLWEVAVRHTHRFLNEGDILFYKSEIMNHYFPILSLYIIYNRLGNAIAFMGLSDEKIEMLFVHPDELHKGYGSILIDYAVREKNIYRVDVNEQNREALAFYLHKGFRIVGRGEEDDFGKPYPVLYLSAER